MRPLKMSLAIIVMILSFIFLILFMPPREVITLGVVDRIVDGEYAVILLEEKAVQIELPLKSLEETVEEGMIIELIEEAENYHMKGINEILTAERQEETKRLFELLQQKESTK